MLATAFAPRLRLVNSYSLGTIEPDTCGVARGPQSGAVSQVALAPPCVQHGRSLVVHQRPSLGKRIFAFPELSADTWSGLPPMLADSLPDSFGNALIDAWMARQGVGRQQITPLDRLAYLGSRGMGALEYMPDTGPHRARPTAIDLPALVVAARSAVNGSLVSESQAGAALQQIINVGTSAGGQRAKAIINLNPAAKEIRSGHLPSEPGFEPWLLKFDGIGRDQQWGPPRSMGASNTPTY